MTKPTFIIDGSKFSSLQEFAEHFSKVVLNGYPWRGNLDAFNDVLRGGFGSPEGGFILQWDNATLSRERLGHAETAKWFEEHLETCHPANIPHLQQRLAEARQGQGETLFDVIIEIIRHHGVGGREAEDGVELFLR